MRGDIVGGRHGRPQQPLEEVPQEYAAFKIEQRGIDLIPDSERKMKPNGLFWLWSGAVFNVEFFYYGTLIMIFGLSVTQAVLVIIIGNLFYALLGFSSLQGPKTGTTAFMVSRAPFGRGHHRHRGLRRGDRHHLVPRQLLHRLLRVPAVHRGLAGALVR